MEIGEKRVKKKSHKSTLRFIKLMNIVLVTLLFAIGWISYYADRTASPYYEKGNYLIVFLFAVLYAVYGKVYDALLVSMNCHSLSIY